MEVGRRFGNQVGDPIAARTPDIRGDATAGGFVCDRLQPTTVSWRGQVLAHISGKRAGAFSFDPFFLSAPTRRRVWLEFFLAGPLNGGEDVLRYLRSVPGDRIAISFTRRTLDQERFRVYHTAGLTGTPAVLVADLGIADRVGGSPTSAQFEYVSDQLAVGGHSFQVRPVDAAGNERTGCTILTSVLAPWPQPPTGVEVHKYNRTSGVVTLKWTAPPDDAAADLYHVFKSPGSGQPVAYGTVVGSATSPVAVTGTPAKPYATFALGLTGPAASGVWLAAVRHKRGSVREDNVTALARFVIATDGRWSASGYPLAPTFIDVVQAPGGRLVAVWKHDAYGEPAETLRFKVYRSHGATGHVGSAVNYATAVAVRTRAEGRFVEATAGFVLTDGLVYRFGVRSEATGGVREVNTAYATAVADATPPTSCPNSMAIAKVVG